MEKLTNNISNEISKELNLDDDNREIVTYGLFSLVQIVISILLVIIFGWLFNVMIEALIVCFTGSTLRKYSGGAHASKPSTCTVIGTIVCIGQALIFKFLAKNIINLDLVLFLGLITFAWSYYIIYKLAPVDNPAKPIRTKEKKARMKKRSVFVLSIYIIIVLTNFAIYFFFKDNKYLIYSMCIFGGVAWQIFTLTSAGHNTIHKTDTFLSQII